MLHFFQSMSNEGKYIFAIRAEASSAFPINPHSSSAAFQMTPQGYKVTAVMFMGMCDLRRMHINRKAKTLSDQML